MPGARAALTTLARRADFLRIAGAGTKYATAGLVLQARRRRAADTAPPGGGRGSTMASRDAIRVGFTASRKVGGAVLRNRAKRRLRALARAILPAEAQPGYDYVLIARAETAARRWPDLEADLRQALARLKLRRDAGTKPS